MSELRSSLLGERKKLDSFEKYYEDCLHRIKRIKQKNDTLQRNAGTELEDQIAVEVHKQKEFMENEISELKAQMDEVEKKYRDPEAKNKMKAIRQEAQKQIERNKTILKEFINKYNNSHQPQSQTKRTRGDPDEEDQGRYFEGGKIDERVQLNGSTNDDARNAAQQYPTRQQQQKLKESDIEIDYEIENKIAEEKTKLLNEVETDAIKINNMINDIGKLVAEQDPMLDHITEETLRANRNVVEANENIEEANTMQKKSKKKTIAIAVIVTIVVVMVVGLVLILRPK